jgi:inhibitor of KinA
MAEPYSIFALGDSAITLDLGERIDEQLNYRALGIREWLAARPLPGMRDVIVAYSSVTIFYDPVEIIEGAMAGGVAGATKAFDFLRELLETGVEQVIASPAEEREAIRIPVCYGGSFGPDLETVSGTTGVPPEELVHLHSSLVYRVFMIGFLPGFPYLGKTDSRLSMPRKVVPVPVTAGSVGIIGIQSCIYPLNSPGGWHIIGRTPLKLFDPQAENPTRLKTGDRVLFFPVTPGEFEEQSQAQ